MVGIKDTSKWLCMHDTSKWHPSDIHVVTFASRYRRVHSCKGLVGKDVSAASQRKQNKPKTTQCMVSDLFSPTWIVLIVTVSMLCSHHPPSFHSFSLFLPPYLSSHPAFRRLFHSHARVPSMCNSHFRCHPVFKTPPYHTCHSNLLSKLSSPPFVYVNCASNCVYVCMFCYGMLYLQSHCFQLFTNYNGNESTMVHSRCKFK